jgi:transposase
MSRPRKQYTKAEKLEIVKLSMESEHKIKDLALRFEVSENSIYKWRKAYLKHEDQAFPGKGNVIMSEEERRIKALEKEVQELRLERDILKKAVGIFSKSDKKFSSL